MQADLEYAEYVLVSSKETGVETGLAVQLL